MATQNVGNDPESNEPKRLYRSKVNRIFAGICGGFAEYFNIDVMIVRIIFLILLFFNGLGILLYLISLIVMNENPEQSAADRKPSENTAIYWGIGLILFGLMLLSPRLSWQFLPFHPFHWYWLDFWPFDWDRFWPVIIILLGVLYLIYIYHQNRVQETAGKSLKKLYRSRNEKVIGGVCGGLAQQLNVDPVLIRLLWVVLALTTKILLGVIIYILWMIFIPEEPLSVSPEPEKPTSEKPKKAPRRVKKLPKKDEPKQEETN